MVKIVYQILNALGLGMQTECVMSELYKILIIKANEMHYISNLFDKLLYIFRTGALPIIRSISTLYTCNRYLQSGWNCSSILTTLADSQYNQHDKYILRVYSVEILLLMESRPLRNMQSTLSNKFEIQCIMLAFIIRIYHDARSSECQTSSIKLRSNTVLRQRDFY